MATERPLPTLLVNFVKLSEKPNTVFFTKLAAPCVFVRSSSSHAAKVLNYFGNTDAKFSVPVDDNTVEWFIEDVSDPGTDVSKQPNRVSDEICRSDDTVKLTEDLLFVVVHNTRFQVGCSQTHVLDSQRIHL